MEHNFKKKFGQNFIDNKELLDGIVSDAKIDNKSFVVEIGAGAGALTEVLAQKAKEVVSFEIDEELRPRLEALAQKHSNLRIVFADFMTQDIKEYTQNKKFCVVANLPYYITTAIISKLIKTRPQTMTILVQKEVGERLCAKPGNSEYGAMSVICQRVAEVEIARQVPRTFFTPQPDVDSVVLHFEFNDKDLPDDFVSFLHICFRAKRKTLINNLSSGLGISKQQAVSIMGEICKPENSRAEELNADEFITLFEKCKKNKLL